MPSRVALVSRVDDGVVKEVVDFEQKYDSERVQRRLQSAASERIYHPNGHRQGQREEQILAKRLDDPDADILDEGRIRIALGDGSTILNVEQLVCYG